MPERILFLTGRLAEKSLHRVLEGLNATEFGLLTATPMLTGSLIRVPLGIWTDKYGGRIVMALLMAATVPATGS